MTAVDAHADPFVAKQNEDRLSAYFRGRRFQLIETMIRGIHARNGSCRIIDIGGRSEYWTPALACLEACKAHVTVVNLENTRPEAGDLFSFRFGDACDLSQWDDGSFDLAHSNSLIEHVGSWERMRACARETRRVARSYYVQTPYFWFPLEPHFRVPLFHWLPESVRARMVTRWKLGYFNRASTVDQAMQNVQSATLIDGWQMRALFPDAEIGFERVAGIPKSLIARHGG